MTARKSEVARNIEQLGGDIVLINFKLEPTQLTVAKDIIGNYIKKIREASNYKGIKIRLKKHEHGKRFLYEIEAESVIREGKKTSEKATEGKNMVLSAAVTSYDLYSALAKVLEKIFSEALHRSRTTKEIGEEMKKS